METTSASPASINLPDLRILVAEDNLNNQIVFNAILRQIRCISLMVENGALAVEAFADKDFDVVILDLQMPVMDGITAVKNLREKFAHAPQRPYFIALTANALNGDERTCLKAGFDRYLTKPITLSHLRSALTLAGQARPFLQTKQDPEKFSAEEETNPDKPNKPDEEKLGFFKTLVKKLEKRIFRRIDP